MQYEDSFKPLYDFVRKKMTKVPKRRYKSVTKPLLEIMNEAYQTILSISEDPVTGSPNSAQTRYDYIVDAQEKLLRAEKPLWVYWNICGDINEPDMKDQRVKQRQNLCERFNYVLRLLRKIQLESSKYNPENDKVVDAEILYYTEDEIANAQFLSTLRELHRFTHGKIVRMTNIFKDAEADILLKLVDDAWYYAARGNKNRLDKEKEREDRKKFFSRAISDLYKMERPLFSIFSLGHYSNNEMKDWMHLLNESLRLLQAVQQSDKRRT